MEIREERKEREIRFYDLFFSVCQRWRSLLICLIIGAVVLGAYGWYKSGNGQGAAAQWGDVLSSSEMWEVEQLYSTQQEYTKLLAEMEAAPDQSKQLEVLSELAKIQSNISNARYLFTEDQKAYFSSLMGDTAVVPGDSATYSAKGTSSVSAPAGRRIQPKYIVIGALLGLILAILFIIIKYIGTATVKSAADVEDTLELPILGRFDGSTKFYDKRHAAPDRYLRKKKQRNRQRIPFEENTAVTAARLQAAAGKLELQQVCLAVDPSVELSRLKRKGFLSEIAEKTGEEPRVLVLESVFGSADSIRDLAESDGAVLVLQTEKTLFSDAGSFRLLCANNDVRMLGAIVVE